MVLFGKVHRYLIFMLVSATVLILCAPVYALVGSDQYGYHYIDSRESGGPDFYWYTANDVLAFDSAGILAAKTIEPYLGPISNKSHSAPVDIGFDFEFYGNTYRYIYISGNGYITFTKAPSSNHYPYTGQDVPADDEVNNFIAPFWNHNDIET